MKTYSRRQLVCFSVAAAVCAFTCGYALFSWMDDVSRRSVEDAFVPAEVGDARDADDIIPTQNGGRFNESERENIEIYERLNGGVVNITTETLTYNWFFEPVPREGGTGSGSIIDERGYILTNYHVVEDAYKVFVTLAAGDRFEGRVIGKDPENDLAIVEFNPDDMELTIVPFGSSSDLRVGQKVLAIGNPFAFERTLTIGIISGLGRPVSRSGSFVIQNMIQTDASINPGNSGGPLLNSRGEMIGVNTMIYSPSGGSVGIGFATPIDTARRVVPDLIAYGTVRRGWLDIVPVQIQPTLARVARLPVEQGILVSRMSSRGAAAEAGLRGGSRSSAIQYGRNVIYTDGDIIVEIDGKPVESMTDYFGALESTRPGDTVDVTVLRGRRRVTIEVTLTERPDDLYGE